MKIATAIFLFVALSTHWLQATDWYAAPNAAITGDGSTNNPWPLPKALQQTSLIQPGDTLNLRGGTYHGSGCLSRISGNAGNYVVVRSIPGEWAIVSDGATGGLITEMPQGSPYVNNANVLISGSEFWSPGIVVMIDSEQLQLAYNRGNPTNWTLTRGWNGTTPTNHRIGSKVSPRSSIIEHSGNYVIFRDFEITSTLSANRIVGTNHQIGCGLNLSSTGKGNKAVNLIVHNVGHPGIGFWNQGDGGEINGCIMWGIGMYDRDGTWTRGTAVYAQNQSGIVHLKNNIVFRCFTEGMQAYGTAAQTSGFRFINNITAMNANGFGIAVWNAGVSMHDNACWTNFHGMDGEMWGYTSTSNTTMSCVGNVFVKPPTLFIKNHLSGGFSNNTVFFDGTRPNSGLLTFQYPETNRADISLMLNRNTYYNTNGDAYLFGFRSADINGRASDGGRMKWTDGTNSWSSWTGWDTNSTYANGWPNNYLNMVVQPLDYNSNRWHICIVNTTSTNDMAINLSALGFASGQRYQLRDAQNYFTVLTNGTYSGSGTVTIPLTLTNVAEIPGITHYTNEHTNVKNPGLFNAFVLERIIGIWLSPPANLRRGISAL